MKPGRLPLNDENLPRVICFAAVAVLHVFLLSFLIFKIDAPQVAPDPPATVMKLADIREYTPPPPPPVELPLVRTTTAETIAEEVIEVEELEEVVEVEQPVAVSEQTVVTRGNTGPDYLPQNAVSVLPQFDRQELQNRTVYPPIARRSNIEGSVILELFIDRGGYVRNIVVLKETPEGRGFAEAAVKAFQGFRAIRPAQANGEDVAVRFRYPVRFTLR